MICRLKKYLFMMGVVFMTVSFCACASSTPEPQSTKEEYPLTLKGWNEALIEDAKTNSNENAQEFFLRYIEANGDQLDKLIESLSMCSQLQGTDGNQYTFLREKTFVQVNDVPFTHYASMGNFCNDSDAIFTEIKKDSELYGKIEKLLSDGLFTGISIVRDAGHSKIYFDISPINTGPAPIIVDLFKIEGNNVDVDKYIKNFNTNNGENKVFNMKDNWCLRYTKVPPT